jgi:hypothetical protein
MYFCQGLVHGGVQFPNLAKIRLNSLDITHGFEPSSQISGIENWEQEVRESGLDAFAA